MLTLQRPTKSHDSTSTAACVFQSDLGWIGLTWRFDTSGSVLLTRITFGHPSAAAAAASLPANTRFVEADELVPPTIDETIGRLQRFAAGETDDLGDIPIDLSHLTPFQRAVVEACRQIAAGQTRSYGDLAAEAGSPRAARAVGNVMRGNRYPLVVPCHRVIGSAGQLCGFTSPEGLAMKERLLRREGVAIAKRR